MTNERRTRSRINLRAQVFLLSAEGGTLVEAETENVSLDGFFCWTSHFFSPAEQLKFLLNLCTDAPDVHLLTPVCLKGLVEVVHVTARHVAPTVGLGCRIASYRVLPNADLSSSEKVLALLESVECSETSPAPFEIPLLSM